MIKVCDAIMGSGKTSASINYMNEHSDRKYIYATPYLDESDRIVKMCPELRFVQPRERMGSTTKSKYYDVMRMLRCGRNIATTHKAISFYTDDTLELIRNNGYTLIIDESITALESTKTSAVDMDMLIKGGFAELDGDIYKTTGKMYDGDIPKFKLLGRLMRSRDIIGSDDVPSGKKFYYWLFRADVLEAFSDVIVMTYLFEAQDIYHCLKVSGLPYRKIGVVLDRNGNYAFSDEIKWMPEYAGRLGSMIHILDNEKLNSIGDKRTALSINWMNNHNDCVKQLKNNIYNYFRNIVGDEYKKERMWGTFTSFKSELSGKGYARSYVVFNERATNRYSDKRVLAYAVNIFPDTKLKRVYAKCGVEIDDDAYALSYMVQWIWRSAIRNGEEIQIYIPSRRMRELLMNWIADVERQYGELMKGGERVCEE